MLAATPAVQCCSELLLRLQRPHLASAFNMQMLKASSCFFQYLPQDFKLKNKICHYIALFAPRCHRAVSGIGQHYFFLTQTICRTSIFHFNFFCGDNGVSDNAFPTYQGKEEDNDVSLILTTSRRVKSAGVFETADYLRRVGDVYSRTRDSAGLGTLMTSDYITIIELEVHDLLSSC